MSSSIVIPENAPFNAEQRAWLSEFLTKVLGGAEVEVESPSRNPCHNFVGESDRQC
jgi:hypothetical protein